MADNADASAKSRLQHFKNKGKDAEVSVQRASLARTQVIMDGHEGGKSLSELWGDIDVNK